jgi:hypothetical protein
MFLANYGAATTSVATIPGRVGNVGTNSTTLRPGWNLIGLSEGKSLPVKTTFTGANPVGSSMEEESDLIVLQNPDGSWRRMMYIQGWGAPYDGNWFDLSTFQIVTNRLEPGQAYYYFRQSTGGATQISY